MSRRTDPIETLTALRPGQATLERQWPAVARQAALRRLTSRLEPVTPPGRRVARRRLRIAAILAAAAAIAVAMPMIVPSDTPGGASPAAAAVIRRLAVRAGQAASDTPPPGGFQHFVTQSRSLMEWEDPRKWRSDPTRVVTREEWVAEDGTVWRRDTHPGAVEHHHFPPTDGTTSSPSFSSPSRRFLATLPTDPDALYDYLWDHVSGSSSHEEAVLVAVGDILRTGMPSPALRAAAITLLERLPITVDQYASDALGRAGVALGWQRPRSDDGGTGSWTLIVDPATSMVLEERHSYRYGTQPRPGTQRLLDSITTVVTTDTATSVPAEVLERAITH